MLHTRLTSAPRCHTGPDAAASATVTTAFVAVLRTLTSPIAGLAERVGEQHAVSVRAAATGTGIGRFSVAANRSDKRSCPDAAFHRFDDVLLRGLYDASFQRQLRPFVLDAR